MARKRLQRSDNAVLGGVCAGIAEYIGISAVSVRVITVILAVLTLGALLPIYLVMWAMTPRCPTDYTAYVDVAPENARCAGSAAQAGAGGAQARCDGADDEAARAEGPAGASAARTAARQGTHPNRPIAIAAGVVLVAAGIAGVASRVTGGHDLWAAWPVIIIVLGVYVIVLGARSGKSSGASVFDGVLITLLGVLMLVCTLGLIPWSIISYITALWPVFLIAAGIALAALGLHSKGLRVVAAVVAICALAVGVANSYSGNDMLVGAVYPQRADARVCGALDRQPAASASLGGASGVSVELTGGASTLVVGGSDDGDDAALYLTTEARRPSAVAYDANRAHLAIAAGSGMLSGPCDVVLPMASTYSQIAVDANGSARLNMDLTDLCVANLSLDTGITNTELTLSQPASGGSLARIDAGTSDLTINVPDGVRLHIVADSGCRLSLPAGYVVTTYGSRQVITNYDPGDAGVSSGADGLQAVDDGYDPDTWEIDERGSLGALVVKDSDGD